MRNCILTAAALALCLPVAAHATTIGSLTFANSAFADDIAVVTGQPSTYDANDPDGPFGVLALDVAGTGSNINTGIFCTADCSFDVLFLDNHVVNGAGADLAVFEGGRNDPLSVTINGISRVLSVADFVAETLFDAAADEVGYWLLDLSEFGVADGGVISMFRIDLLFDEQRGGDFASADFVVAGALNSAAIPLPAAGWLLLAGVGGLAAMRRRPGRSD